ncbi:MAG: DinB family protein [Chloroflexi bacterium]|nr:DinB family protein [Chloroflexota bacterium]
MPISASLRQSVMDFAALTQALPEDRLNAAWNWRGYEEGMRFIHFRFLEELNWLAAALGAKKKPTPAQRLMAQHHAAWWDLRAVLLGVSDDLLDRAPVPGEWTLRETLVHIIEVEWSHTKISEFAIQRARAGETDLASVPDDAWDPHFVERGGFSKEAFSGSLGSILAFHDRTHHQVLKAFHDVTPEEMFLKAVFWEPENFEIAFRLGRFASHMAQHTIQIEKTLAILDHPMSEARMLHRRIFAALAGAESACLMLAKMPKECAETADYFCRLAAEAKAALEAAA